MGYKDSRSRSRSRGRAGRSRSPKGRDGSRERFRGGRSPRARSITPDTRPGVTTDEIVLEAGAVAYLLGRSGATKQRLANFSGARLEIDPKGDDGGRVQIIGTEVEQKLARLCIDITLQQRNNGKVVVDLDMLDSRKDVSTLDVEQNAVGFVLGSKGATLRELETKYKTFMFFDNDNIRDNKKRLYILGTPDNRAKALGECENAVNYKLSGNGSLSSWRDYQDGRGGRPSRYDEDYKRGSSPPRGYGGGGRGGFRGDDRRGGGGGYGGGGRSSGGYGGGDRDRDRDRHDRRSPPRRRNSRSRSPKRGYPDQRR